MINFVNKLKENWAICVIILLALILRLIGISHNYPFILNIDEPTIVRSTMGLFFTLEIDHFDWPHFNYYFHFPFYLFFIKFRGLLQIMGMREVLENAFPILWNDPFVFYSISRSITAILSGLAVIPVYLLGKSMFNKRVGLVSALFLAITPYLIFNAHFTMQDGVILFWAMWGVLFSYLAARDNRIKYYILAGGAFALASGVKYNAVLIALILPLFVIYRIYYKKPKSYFEEIKNHILPLILSGIIFVVLFLLTNPLIILDWQLFWSYEQGRGFLWQLKKNSNPVALIVYPYYLFDRTKVLIISMGISIPLLSISSLFLARKAKYREKTWVIYPLFVLVLGFILFTARYERSGAHYFLPIYGIITILAGFAYIAIIEDYFHKHKMVFSTIVFLPLVFLSIITLSKFMVEDTRREALNYYKMGKENDLPTYYLGNDFSEINGINNLGLKKFVEHDESYLTLDSYILSEKELEDNDRITIVKVINSKLYKHGPNVYVYQIQ